MSAPFETVFVLAAVLGAGLYLAMRLFRAKRKGGGCGSGCGCGVKRGADFVKPDRDPGKSI
jgi:hypothetical protein